MAGGEDASSLFSFFFYVLFVYPAANWILKPGRFSKAKGLAYAIGMLVAIAAVKTGFEMAERGPNYYQKLDVSRGSSAIDVKRAYKRMSLELHPDKNPSATAVDDFASLKDAYDVLMDQEQRDVYNRFGEEAVKSKKHIDEYRMLLEIAVFYVAWGVMAFLLTLGKASASARQWIFTGQIAMFVTEVLLMLNELHLPDWFLPRVTPHEIVVLMRSLFPAYLNGCRCIGGVLYVDLDEHQRQLLLALTDQNKEILSALHGLHAAVLASAKQRASEGGSSSPHDAASPLKGGGGGAPAKDPKHVLNSIEAALRANGAILSGSNAPQTIHPATMTLTKPDNKSNLSLYIMIAVYIGAYYIFSG